MQTLRRDSSLAQVGYRKNKDMYIRMNQRIALCRSMISRRHLGAVLDLSFDSYVLPKKLTYINLQPTKQ